MFKFFIHVLCVSLFVACSSDSATDPNDPKFDIPEEGITLNLNNTFQVIDHFGASGGFQDQWVGKWPEASKEPIAKLLFSSETDAQGNPLGIGLSLWRTIIGDGAADQSNSGFKSSSWFRETECLLDESGNYDWTKQAGEQWFLSKARDYGVSKFTAWATTPPYFMTKNGYTFSTSDVNGFNCPESNYSAYAKFITTVVKHYETEGYNFETVCAFNETQYDWNAQAGEASQSGTKAFNSEVAAVTRIMDNEFVDAGINAKIMVPEAAQLKYLFEGSQNTTNQVNDFFNSSSSNYIGNLTSLSSHIAGHSYFSNGSTNESLRQRKSLRTALSSYGLDYWQTEYSLLGAAYQQGLDVSTFKEIDYALWLSRIIHTDLVFGNATGWSFWTALNQSTFGDHPFRFNLILYQPNSNSPSHTDGTFEENKLLWALGNFSRFVKPGMVRFEVNDPDYSDETSVENFMISGYKSTANNEIVLVCVNNTDSNREISLENYEKDFEVKNGSFESYTTSSGSNLRKSTMQYDAISIPSKSIVTLKAVTK
ncbi:glycoside hydrolase [uncultured Algibacter sp.]|uniref:glycoside hydrolase n=1 Tax=uncultured Algibacter sp. TaxID=298659 RepID=UPI0026287E09|nr:glycoside hydrolase [uncultured Algibacter sp.]